MSIRYEWIAGPRLASGFASEFHAGKGVLERKGHKFRFLVGQVRDRELGTLLNWAIYSPKNPTNARLAISALERAYPIAPDWSPRLRRGLDPIPAGWKPPPSDSEFVLGLVI